MTKSDSRKLKGGETFSRTSYGTVIARTDDRVTIKNEDDVTWSVSNDIFEAEFTVADQHRNVVTVTQTELIDWIIRYPRTAMTVSFRKKPDPKVVTETIREMLDDENMESILQSRLFRTTIGQLMLGDARVMVGRHYGDVDPRGRLRFIENGEPRLVDPRTVDYAIIDNVRYEVG